MCAELVTLYTTANIDDPSPQAFQYYLDYSGAQCLQVAMQNLGMQFDYKYGLLLRSTEMKWLDLNDTLRNQGVATGYMIIVYPIEQQETQQTETKPIVIQEIEMEAEPTYVASQAENEEANYMTNIDDADDTIDIRIDAGISDFSTNNFGGLRASDFSLITGEEASETEKPVTIYTSEGFSTEQPTQAKYHLNYSFDDVVATALRHLNKNRDGKYAILLQYGSEDRRWFGETNYLEDYNPYNGMTLYIFKRERTVRIHSTIK